MGSPFRSALNATICFFNALIWSGVRDWRLGRGRDGLVGLLVSLVRERVRPAILLVLLVLNVLLAEKPLMLLLCCW